MLTQEDMHNILVKSDVNYKMQVIRQCGFDIDKIKEFERKLAEICNVSIETASGVINYMSTEI